MGVLPGGDKKSSNDHLKGGTRCVYLSATEAMVTSAKGTVPPAGRSVVSAQGIRAARTFCKVAALASRIRSDRLRINFAERSSQTFVQTPQGDKYYRVQVGPLYGPESHADREKGLETAGLQSDTSTDAVVPLAGWPHSDPQKNFPPVSA